MADEEYHMPTKADDWQEAIKDLERIADQLNDFIRRDQVSNELIEAYHLVVVAFLRLEAAFEAHKHEIY